MEDWLKSVALTRRPFDTNGRSQ
ncbi:Protein of unknown function [Bacillus mycoides]|uniref:Uncharacterized protein n=1 Tax=Bacillus mycoides TaxID=1405 RepID=A0A1G4ELA8_BACMY|nr:Protein of unknown function [Bacillus mycoides]